MTTFPRPTPFICKSCKSPVIEDQVTNVTHADGDGSPVERTVIMKVCPSQKCPGYHGLEEDDMERIEGDLTSDSPPNV